VKGVGLLKLDFSSSTFQHSLKLVKAMLFGERKQPKRESDCYMKYMRTFKIVASY